MQIMSRSVGACVIVGCAIVASSDAHMPIAFSAPQHVAIRGYHDDATQPFLTRNGNYFFFNNNSNAPRVNTSLHWAERIDDLPFLYMGEIGGVNLRALEGVASMDRNGSFYFVSNRSYDQAASTIYRGHFATGSVSRVELAPGVSSMPSGIVNFDAEISADGDTLYFVESQFSLLRHRPETAKILIARRAGSRFRRALKSDTLLREINTRVSTATVRPATQRPAPGAAAVFGAPEKIQAITGFAEGPTLSPDGKSPYHRCKENGKSVLYRVTR
jgi:hypothetical protein